jgi:hypothetical protein
MHQQFGPYVEGYYNAITDQYEISITRIVCTAQEADEIAANLRAAVLWAREKTRKAQDEQTPSLF